MGGGIQTKKPSVGGVQIFSGTPRYNMFLWYTDNLLGVHILPKIVNAFFTGIY